MIRDLTIGQYYATSSPVHALDPRTKLFAVLAYIVALFLVQDARSYLVFCLLILLLYHVAKVPFRYLLRGLRGVVLLLLLTFLLRMIATPGEVLWQWHFLEVTREGVDSAVRLTARIALMIAGASLLSYTATPKELADGLEKACQPLEKLHVPIHDMATIVMVAFHFIPIMIEELNLLMDAQAARGAQYEEASVLAKTKSTCTLLMPLFLSTLRKSSDLAMAMEARGYRGQPTRAKLHPLVYRRQDRLVYAGVFIFLGLLIVLRVLGLPV